MQHQGASQNVGREREGVEKAGREGGREGVECEREHSLLSGERNNLLSDNQASGVI